MADAGKEATGIIVLDGDPEQRERIEAMAEALGVEIWAATPEDLVPERPDTWESLTQARAVVASAQFGGRKGLEVIEWLAWNGAPKPSILALSVDRPHRVWIESAVRAGADACLLRPIDQDEFQQKVVDASAPPTDEAGGEDEAGDKDEAGTADSETETTEAAEE